MSSFNITLLGSFINSKEGKRNLQYFYDVFKINIIIFFLAMASNFYCVVSVSLETDWREF